MRRIRDQVDETFPALRYVIERKGMQGIWAGKFYVEGSLRSRDAYRKRLASVVRGGHRGELVAYCGLIDEHGRWVHRHCIFRRPWPPKLEV